MAVLTAISDNWGGTQVVVAWIRICGSVGIFGVRLTRNLRILPYGLCKTAESCLSRRAYVTIADVDKVNGARLASKLSGCIISKLNQQPMNLILVNSKTQFVECDVTIWEDQVNVFELAMANSPHKSCDIVIANAGISGPDPLFVLDGENLPLLHLQRLMKLDISKPPVKPDLRIIDIDLIGVLYTSKLAMHYFRMQPEDTDRDRCLIIKGSVAGFLDQPGTPQYNVAKFGGRALMRCLRRTSWQQGIRVNYVAPW